MSDSFVFVNADLLINACELRIKDIIRWKEEDTEKYTKSVFQKKRKINKIANRYFILIKKYPFLKLFLKKKKRLSFEETIKEIVKYNGFNEFISINYRFSERMDEMNLLMDMAKVSKIKSNSKVLLSEEKFRRIQRYINYEDK